MVLSILEAQSLIFTADGDFQLSLESDSLTQCIADVTRSNDWRGLLVEFRPFSGDGIFNRFQLF